MKGFLKFKNADVTHVHLGLARVADRDSFLQIYELPHYPVFFDKNLVCYGAALDEYLHERYPAPALLPADPAARAHVRLMAEDVHRWYTMTAGDLDDAMDEYLLELDHNVPFFTGRIPSLVDATAAPPLLQFTEQKLRSYSRPVRDYIARLREHFGLV